MKLAITRQWLGAIALFGALAFVAACSGSSASGVMSPTGPSGAAAFSGGATFNPFPDDPPEIDPCVETAAVGFSPNPEEPPDPECGTGRFTGGGFQIGVNDVRVTRGFTLHCDALLSNNFEVNWAGGNNFHINKNQPVVSCTFVNDPTPPVAPVNRIEIIGTGKLNGVDGATVHLVLIDNGEPGKDNDQAYIAINGTPLTLGSSASPVTIDGGNVQAHYDQPHGSNFNK